MSHDVCIDLWRPCEQDLTSDWKALWILNTRHVTSGVSHTIKHHFRTHTKEGVIKMSKFASEELHTEAIELVLEILDMSRRLDSYCSERDIVRDARDELI